ncbi:MAG: hypothetical protein EP341_11375 [Sphingomonadales bacterium]|nr:MAG: hypothetical protein EP341_11375 [Sphingomonadales bacterium]
MIDFLEESNRIKDRLRGAGSVEEIESISDEERGTFKLIAAAGEDGKVQALHIANLKAIMLGDMERE